MGPENRPTAVDWAATDGDMDAESFREAGHRIVDILADYFATIEDRPILPTIAPGSIAARFPTTPPEDPEPFESILADYQASIEPNANHWGHPGFMAWFPSANAAPGVLGEFLAAGIGQNTFLWRTSPVGTELETVVVGWLRDALGLPPAFDGFLTDTASTSSLLALAGARETAGLDASARGLAARSDVAAPRVYASAEAHSSIDKAAMALGVGRANVVRVPTDGAFRMRPDELAAAIARDRAAGHRPIAIVATLGSTNTTAIDPIAEIAEIADREGLWLHADAAYGGTAAIVPELRGLFSGWERATSIVVNPHKWLAVPFDASLLLTTRLDALQTAFSLVPEYLRPLDETAATRNVSEYTQQLGRRFRALKLWVMLRAFGMAGLRRRIGFHVELTRRLVSWVEADPDWIVVAPAPLSTVCLRWRPLAVAGREDEPATAAALDAANQAIIEAVNASGDVYLSHTRLAGRFTIRVALGHIRGEERHVRRAWELLRGAAVSQAWVITGNGSSGRLIDEVARPDHVGG